MYKVLLVDDEIKNYQLFQKLVNWEEKGFTIAGTAADGLEALQLYEELQPDLIFMDIQLPMMDGLECVRCIREENEEIPIIIVSAYGEFNYAQKAIRYGVQEFLLKPVSRMMLNQLVDKMKLLLDSRKNTVEFSEEDVKAYTEYEIVTEAWEPKILEAIAKGNDEYLRTQLQEIYEDAEKQNLKPEILRDFTLNLLFDMKFCLKRLEPEKSFEMMRNIKMEMIYQMNRPQELWNYLTEKMDEVFKQIMTDNEQKSRSGMIILQANAVAELCYTDSDFSVQNAANRIGISKNYFVSMYKEKTGKGYWEFVTELRIKKAKECLMISDDTLAVIAEKTGYRNEFYFSRKFKEQEGISPKKFRERYQKKKSNI